MMLGKTMVHWLCGIPALLFVAGVPAAMAAPSDAGVQTAQGEYGKAFTIKRGKSIVFPDFAMTFLSHSHKDVAAGQSSPLIVYLKYKTNGRSKDFPVSLNPKDGVASRTWEWSKYRFTLGTYEYNKWMKLIVKKK
jgi:hypothetical protein